MLRQQTATTRSPSGHDWRQVTELPGALRVY